MSEGPENEYAAAYMHSLETERTALKITVTELEEQLADARAELGRLTELTQVSDRGIQHAARLVETALRRADVSEVRLWGSPWAAGVIEGRVSVTLTLRNGRGELHSETLGGAAARALKEHGGG